MTNRGRVEVDTRPSGADPIGNIALAIPALNALLGCAPDESSPSGVAYELAREIHDDVLRDGPRR